VYTPEEALEKLPVGPWSFRTAFYSSHAAFEKQLNTTAKGFLKFRENSKSLC
jgi:hypothetical protein